MFYLSAADILYIHSRITTTTHARPGVRELAIIKKATKYLHENEMFPTIFDKAGALLFALTRKQPFVDANLATAIGATGVFLRINKHSLCVDTAFIEKLLSAQRATVADYAAVIRDHTDKILAQ